MGDHGTACHVMPHSTLHLPLLCPHHEGMQGSVCEPPKWGDGPCKYRRLLFLRDSGGRELKEQNSVPMFWVGKKVPGGPQALCLTHDLDCKTCLKYLINVAFPGRVQFFYFSPYNLACKVCECLRVCVYSANVPCCLLG